MWAPVGRCPCQKACLPVAQVLMLWPPVSPLRVSLPLLASPSAGGTCFPVEQPSGTCLALLKSHLKTRLSCSVDKKQINNNNNPICFLLRAPCSLHPICSVLPGLWASRVVSPADGCCQPTSVPCVPLLAWPLPSPTQNLFSEQGEKCKWKAARVLFHLFSAQALMSFERLSYSNCWN